MDTFNAFVKFISDDPIMLGLCIAIIVLIIAFILVLFMGRKKQDKEDCIADNTAELLKTEINMDALKSTQEFSVNELQNEIPKSSLEVETPEMPMETFGGMPEPIAPTPSIDIPTPESNPVPNSIEVPVTIEANPVALEVPEPAVISAVNGEIPIVTPKVEAPASMTPAETSVPNSIYDSNIFDIDTKEAPARESIIKPAPLDEQAVSPIIESTVNPIDPSSIPSLESIFGAHSTTEKEPDAPIKDITNEPVKQESITPNAADESIKVESPKLEAPFSSVNVDANAELPSINMDEFSRTEIIRHVPIMEETPVKPESIIKPKQEEDLDDIDLPMFNTNTKSEQPSNGINAFQGETFNI